MLIFDRFETRSKAEEFATTVAARYGLRAAVYDSQEESDAVDIFPFRLDPPIVHVERTDTELEYESESLVEHFGGKFAGT